MVNIKEKINEGYIHSNIILEVLGKPKEHIVKSLELFLKKIEDNKEFEVVKKSVSEPKEVEKEKGFYSTFAELEMLFKDLPSLVGFCFDYMPSSVEIIAPDSLRFDKKSVSDMMNDLQAKLHDVDMRLKNANNQNQFLKKNINHALKNCIRVGLSTGPKTEKEIEGYTGIAQGEAKPLLKNMLEDKLIEEKEGKYSILIKNES